MTPEERAWTDDVRCRALTLVTKCLRIEQETTEGTAAYRIAHDAGLLAMSLMADAGKRMGLADLAADETAVQASDYDLAALASASCSKIEE